MKIYKTLRTNSVIESQKIQSQLQRAITEKGRELDEVRINAVRPNNRISQAMMQHMKDKFERTEQSLLQVETIFNYNSGSLRLTYFANSGNKVVPVVTKLNIRRMIIVWTPQDLYEGCRIQNVLNNVCQW